MKLKENLGKLLIFCGIFIIFIAELIKCWTAYKENSLIEQYQQSNQNHLERTTVESEMLSDTNETGSTDSTEGIISETEGILGILEVPKIELTVAIGEGTDNKTLKYSVGHFSDTALPGEKGNCALIGHRNYIFGQFFNRLNELEVGDTFSIKRNNKEFVYEVYEVKVVEPEDLSVLEPTDEPTATLITCTPIRTATHRLIIKAYIQDFAN